MFFWIIFIVVNTLYLLLILAFSISWIRLKPFGPDNTMTRYTFLSVIVAVRNESKTIDHLLNQLKNQHYPADKFEVYLVNDHSTDSTVEKINQLITQLDNFQVLHLPNGTIGKKAALKAGVQKANGEVCVFTDADCQIPVRWLETLNRFYLSQQKPDMIIGLVDFEEESNLLHTLFRLEFLSLILSSAGAAALGHPVFCNGANLAVKRIEYQLSGSFKEELASGDDVFLLHAMKAEKKKIRLLVSADHLVKSNAPATIKAFFNQRHRWGSKARHYSDIETLLLALLVAGANLLLLIAIPFELFGKPTGFFGPGLIMKIMADFALFASGNKFFRLNLKLLLVPLMEFVYPFYITIVAALAIKKPFTWKGRLFK